jgi:hypothetical protein
MEETLNTSVVAVNGSGPGHDTGVSFATPASVAAAAAVAAAPCALKPEPPAPAELQAEIRDLLAARIPTCWR